ncbi:hypothetical protein Tsubulata_004656 [Turnera subulata]|uniref:Piwi domain-containing protein n=1 Tax=Turnera subulata TaxID=218843 RepID=A0A9Q0JNP3_9ROSI|nr:hypothetical protein Tsubulata_004656 [Turnera subulata]
MKASSHLLLLPLLLGLFGHGQSNPTFLFEVGDGSGSVKRYVLRKKPPGKLLQSAHAVDREYHVLQALGDHTQVPVPKAFCLCFDDSVIGTAFYIMEYPDGRIFIDPKLPGVLPERRNAIYRETARVLAALHSANVDAIGFIVLKGQKVLAWFRTVHFDLEIYPNPYEFNPFTRDTQHDVTHHHLFLFLILSGELPPPPFLFSVRAAAPSRLLLRNWRAFDQMEPPTNPSTESNDENTVNSANPATDERQQPSPSTLRPDAPEYHPQPRPTSLRFVPVFPLSLDQQVPSQQSYQGVVPHAGFVSCPRQPQSLSDFAKESNDENTVNSANPATDERQQPSPSTLRPYALEYHPQPRPTSSRFVPVFPLSLDQQVPSQQSYQRVVPHAGFVSCPRQPQSLNDFAKEVGSSSSPKKKSTRDLPSRPALGQAGSQCLIMTNWHHIDAYGTIFHYNLTIRQVYPEKLHHSDIQPPGRRAVVEALLSIVDVGRDNVAYDGMQTLYSIRELAIDCESVQVTLDEGTRTQRCFLVTIKNKHQVCLHDSVIESNDYKRLKALRIILNDSCRLSRERQLFFNPIQTMDDISGVLQMRKSSRHTVRHMQSGISIGVDLACTAVNKSIGVIEFVKTLLPRHHTLEEFSDDDSDLIAGVLKGVRVKVKLQENTFKYCIEGLTSEATSELRCNPTDGQTNSPKKIVEYFLEKHNFNIKYVGLPCLKMKRKRETYLPMEVCEIIDFQKTLKKLDPGEKIKFDRAARDCHGKRDEAIKEMLSDAWDTKKENFGVRINMKPAPVLARVLPSPIQEKTFGGSRKENLADQLETVKNLLCINFSNSDVEKFYRRLGHECNRKGIGTTFALGPYEVLSVDDPDWVERLKGKVQENKPDLVIAILPHKGSVYGKLKAVCETDIGLMTQCCLVKYIKEEKHFYLANVASKINLKVGGQIRRICHPIDQYVSKRTIILGADVNHPVDVSHQSIAAVVASQDWPFCTKYVASVSSQKFVELIQNMYNDSNGGMIGQLLDSYISNNSPFLPEQIIFFRDGISEKQYGVFLKEEVGAIEKAVYDRLRMSLPITVVVVLKRNQTRFLGEVMQGEQQLVTISAGTIVDSEICHPAEFDFYLCSNEVKQRLTRRPPRYHVLRDDNNISADQLQNLTYRLCHTDVRPDPISIVWPVQYAHLAAKRGRAHMDETSNKAKKSLPTLKYNVKELMYFS